MIQDLHVNLVNILLILLKGFLHCLTDVSR
jgi:hypothetical protein